MLMRRIQFPICLMRNSFLVAILILVALPAYSQMPGNWKQSIVCNHCQPPLGIDFDSTGHGVILLQPQRIGLKTHATSILFTTDLGESWVLHRDTIPLIDVGVGDKIGVRGDAVTILSHFGTTLRATSYGDSVEILARRSSSYEYDYYLLPAARHLVARSPEADEHILEIMVGADTGSEYSVLSTTTLASDDFIGKLRFQDSTQIWMTVFNAPGGGGLPKLPRLLYSSDRGVNWKDVYPFDTTGVNGSNSSFGYGSTIPYEGISPGYESGSVYLLYNFYKAGTPESRTLDILFSTDYGKTWTGDSTHVISKKPYVDVELIRNSGGRNLWLVLGNRQTVAYSPDNAKTWLHDSLTFKGTRIVSMIWKDSVTGYVLTYSTDSTLAFWRYSTGPSSVEHYDNYPSKIFRLRSSFAISGHIKLQALQPVTAKAIAYDIMGREIWKGKVQASTFETLELELPNIPGVYFFTVQQGTNRQSLRYLVR